MDALKVIISFIGAHTTKILGGLGATFAYLNGMGVIPDAQMKYYGAVIGVLTIWRGVFSANAYRNGVADGLAGLPLPPKDPLFSPKVAPK